MQNIAGVSQTEAQKSSDLMMKCKYMDEITSGKGVIFATGTPIYTLQLLKKANKYVKKIKADTRKNLGICFFDSIDEKG